MAQTSVSPTANTVQFAGTPGASSITQPDGGIVLYGTAISPVSNQPVRHLWVADSSAGICRMDPDLDSPGPYAINPASCPFAATRVTGGGMAFDAGRNLLYFVDNRSATRGAFRISYLSGGDSGNGSFDAGSIFSMGGNTTSDIFPSQTGCPFPGNNPQLPNSTALDPEGNLWVGFGRSGEIIRFNNPGAATAANFGGCNSFVQVVAATPDNHLSNGLAWIGHDLWSIDGKSPFFIRNADTACLVSPNPACTDKSGTRELISVTNGSVMMGDQVYPATNGNNLYIGLAAPANNLAWIGDVAGGSAKQTLALPYINAAQLASAPSNIRALALDTTDPANLVVYAGDDPSGIGTVGVGRWFQTTQTALAPAVPGAPLNVVAAENGADAIVSWSPAQSAQPVTSYTVHNNFASNGLPLPDVSVLPNAGGLYPATSVAIPGLAPQIIYQFQVLASNVQGSSVYSAPSNTIPVGETLPGTPSAVKAVAGDAQAAVSWTLPQSVNGITSYTVTALVNGTPTGITATVPAPPAGSSSANAVLSSLANGTAYTFTVHATSAAGNGLESAASLAIIPQSTNVPNTTIVVNGPSGVASTPTQVTYGVVVTNASLFPINTVTVSNILTTTDGAFLISAVPDQGTCTALGAGATQTICSLGNMAPGQVLNITVVAQMNAATITNTAKVTAFDSNGNSLTFSQAFRTTQPSLPPPPPPPNTKVPVVVQANAIPTDLHPLSQGTILWKVSNNTTTVANNIVFTITIDPLLAVDSVAVTPNSGSDPASCGAPAPGLGGNQIVCTIATLGGPTVNNVTPVQAMNVTVFYTSPNRTGLQFTPSGTVAFDGIDSSNPTAGVVIRVR
ncbi:MAG TPA: fibronectin type III domain-containing protein [Terriglobales bacterium]|nr:fibronectin type III domain-containing protein [Terriglobales bacterium]